MSLARRDGVIVSIERAARRLSISFGGRPVQLTAISWGDVSTAFHSTGIGNVATYTQLPRGASPGARIAGFATSVPGAGRLVRGALARAVGRMPNPTAESMATGGVELWARATDPSGATVERRMRTPDGYLLTADSVVRIASRLCAGGLPAGAHTPSSLLGAQFALELDGVQLVD
jgi:saccharopine dehydrogenase (NAD+, L-lysine-forming)